MTGLTRRLLPLLTAFSMALCLAACAGESQPDAEGGEEAGEHAAMERAAEDAAMEGGGEHAEGGGEHGGEHSEGGEGGEHSGEHAEGGEHEGEHSGEHGGEAHDEEGEESGVYIAADETWDVTRRGARLVLSFDSEANAFVGTVANTTEQKLCAIRVEVHLSTGTELGPTARVDLDPGQTTSVTLPTEGEAFESFTAHPEMSPCGLS